MRPSVAFCLPLAYTLHTRLLSRWQRVAWVFTYVVPAAGMYLLAGGAAPLAFSLCLLLIYTRYEAGYIVNDAVLTRLEPHPTHRLTAPFIAWYVSHRTAVHAARWLIAAVLLALIAASDSVRLALQYGAGALAISLIYVLYNQIRSRWTIPLYTVLVALRYGLPALPYLDHPAQGIALFACYPALAMIEFCGKPRFGLAWAGDYVRNVDRNRVLYYTALTLILVAAGQGIPALHDWSLLAAYFLAYRAATFLLSAKFRAG